MSKYMILKELVLCKECIYWNCKGYCRRFNLNKGQFNPDLEAYMPMEAEDYCSMGEKYEDD